MSEEKLKIGLPNQGVIRYYVYSFLELLQPSAESISPFDDHVLVSSYDIMKCLADAFEIIVSRIKETKNRYKPFIPLYGNDIKILNTAKKELGVGADEEIDKMFEVYIDKIKKKEFSIVDLNNSLYPFGGGNLSAPSIFNIEFYGYTRGPYFEGKYKIEYKLSLHALLILLAGYINARCLRFKMGNESVSVLIFPTSATEIRPFLIFKTTEIRVPLQRMIEEEASEQALPSIYPVEALALWLLINLPEKVRETIDLYVVAINEPRGENPASPMTDFYIPLSTLSILMEDFLSIVKSRDQYYRTELRKEEGYIGKLNKDLINPALRYGITRNLEKLKGKGRRAKSKEMIEEEAFKFVKLLFVAAQKGRLSERIELLNLSSRRYLLLKKQAEEEGSLRLIANLNLMVGELARALVEKLYV